MRRLDVQEVLGRVLMPRVDSTYLIDVLFELKPTRGDRSLSEGDLEPWERRRGIEFAPWQAELIVDMSHTYLRYSHEGTQVAARSPWAEANDMWMQVTSAKAKQDDERQRKINERREQLNGNCKRR